MKALMQGNTEIETKEGRARYRLTIVWMWVGIIVLCGVGVFLSGVLSNAIGIVIWAVVIAFAVLYPFILIYDFQLVCSEILPDW